MPSAINEGHGVPQVAAVEDLLNESLDHARIVKPTFSIEPPLNKSDFEALFTRLPSVFANAVIGQIPDKARQYAIIETAARDLFSNLIVRPTEIEARFRPPTPTDLFFLLFLGQYHHRLT